MNALPRWLAVPLAVVLLSGAVVLYLYADFRAFLDAPLKLPAGGLEFTVPPGDSINGIARRLHEQGVLAGPWRWQSYARLTGQARRIKAGEYRLEPGTTARALLEQLVAGRVIQQALTIVEGWTFRQLLAAVAAHPKLEQTLRGLDPATVMARLGRPGEHPEGRFWPDTYFFAAGTRDVDVLRRANATLERRLRDAWAQRAPDLPLKTPYEALILASIVEKETALPAERREVAGVFVRRLRKGMLLQADPTVVYGLGERFDGNLRREDLHSDNPYNSYTRTGLPPTPIALPGAGALAAAVNPAPGETLYFVATGNGSHVFSRTLEEHQQAVRKYQLPRR